jgi:hypothetical protein
LITRIIFGDEYRSLSSSLCSLLHSAVPCVRHFTNVSSHSLLLTHYVAKTAPTHYAAPHYVTSSVLVLLSPFYCTCTLQHSALTQP